MALIKRENISLAFEKYTDNKGDEKTVWKTIGEVLTFENEGRVSKMVKLYSMPGASISLFEQKPREGTQKVAPHQKPIVSTVQQDEPPANINKEEDEINIKDIPF